MSTDGFKAAMTARGLHPPQHLEPGKLHRCASNGKAGDMAGWCKLFPDGVGGVFGDWREGWQETWQAERAQPMSATERDAWRRQMQEAERQRAAEARADQAAAAERAARLWQEATDAPADHPYLVAKSVKPHGLHVHEGMLVVPVRNGTELMSLQFIGADGGKRFLSGGRVAGGYFGIGRPDGVLCIAEGFATGASIHEATGHAVAVAFNCGNLLPVAQAMRAKFPGLRLILCADDDAGTEGNPGLSKARAVVEAAGGYLAVPDFGSDRPAGATDFNDLAQHAGADAVRACIERAQRIEAVPMMGAVTADTQMGWSVPQSLDRVAVEAQPYPLAALPEAIRAAVTEYQSYGQQPVALVASSALAVVSLAAQGLADVARNDRLIGPASLFFIVIAQSGERKTAADKALGAMLGEWERAKGDSLREDIQRNKAAQAAWQAEKEGIEGELRQAAKKERGKLEELRERLEHHELNKPSEVIAPRLRYEDVNPQSLAFHLAKGHLSAALWSDEGGMVTGSMGMGRDSLLGFMAGLNRLWDGGAIHHDRKQAESVHLEGRRLTVSLMVQPGVLRDLSQRSAGLTRGSGFLARFLIAAPVSTMGTRLYREPPAGMPSLDAFGRRIRELLDVLLPVDDHGRLTPAVLRLSPEAAATWQAYHDEVERQLAPLGALREVPDFAAKSAENAARIAGCLHVYRGAQGAIDAGTMESAVTLARWYLWECLRVLDLLDEPLAWADARALDAWLMDRGDCSTRDAQQFGPVRDKARRDAALEVLADLDRIEIEDHGRRKLIHLNPALRRFATATPATVATHERQRTPSVAEVATVAVANCRNSMAEADEGDVL